MVVMSTSSQRWGLILTQGIFAIIIGVLLLIAPLITVTVAVVFLGAWWLVMGVIAIVGIFTGYTKAHWGWALFGYRLSCPMPGVRGPRWGGVVFQPSMTPQ